MVAQTQTYKYNNMEWFVYKFNDKGKISYLASAKSEDYFNPDLLPTIITSNIDRGEAYVIERALNAYIEAPNYIIEELTEADCWDGDESYNALQ